MLISVVMAVYNGELYLQEAIDSILQQTYPEFEFIIVNDGSTDKTIQILNDIQDPRVRLIHLPKNVGAASALNRGIQEAEGKWIAIQDADDLSYPSRLKEQISYVKDHPGIAAVGTLRKCISGRNEIPKKRLRTEEFSNYLVSGEHLRAYRFYINPLCHGSVLFSKEIFKKIGGYDPSYKICYDYDLWIRMLEVGSIHKINKVLYHYRIHPESISRKKQPYNEDWLVASTHIKKIAKKQYHDTRDPVFLVIGNSNACNEFKQICSLSKLKVDCYLQSTDSGTLEAIHQLIKKQLIDSVILLEGIQYLSIFQALEEKGMEWNRNLFKIWAGYWN
ncbi:glycosyltransferase family 2 protein [Pseudalkalibacillus salsuginis]|uniref:glycosyltransferase family 2 protein n=1 Tax=Pseudalkalibacillus salsuginis TaxID=2910972 RepID=UPI001F1DCEC6|nr:glycosyltransferase [Pseudalkalibacillus salsuginis]MCF6409136.1 glycosyltransferase [Pseudalkalibacillus salsuginis]